MNLDDFLAIRHIGIKKKEKAGETYLIELIRENYSEYKEIFSPDFTTLELDIKNIYNGIKKTIKDLEKSYCTIGKWEESKSITPGTQLGWTNAIKHFQENVHSSNMKFTEFIKFAESQATYMISLTEKGKEIINNYLGAQGYVSLDEQQKRNREIFFPSKK